MLQLGPSYDEVYNGFRWQLPERFNIGTAACDRHADGGGRLALVSEASDGTVERFTFDDFRRLSNKCANALSALGIRPGDRVGVLLTQRPETAIAHLAIYKLGAVALPLFTQFGPDALEHRIADSGATALIIDGENLPKLPADLPELATILVVDGDSAGNPLFWPTLEGASDEFSPLATGIDDPALVIYTSGTTGRQRALYTPRECCSATSREYSCRTSSSLRRAIVTGPRPIGRGSAGSSMCCCRAFISASRCSRIAHASSIPRKRSP